MDTCVELGEPEMICSECVVCDVFGRDPMHGSDYHEGGFMAALLLTLGLTICTRRDSRTRRYGSLRPFAGRLCPCFEGDDSYFDPDFASLRIGLFDLMGPGRSVCSTGRKPRAIIPWTLKE